MGGVLYTGLNYAGVETLLRRSGLTPKKQDKVFKDLQLIEQGALSEINKKQD